MNLKTMAKRGISLSLAVMLGAAGVPTSGFMPVMHTYAASEDAAEETVDVLAAFDFNTGIGGWYYGKDWAYNYSAQDSSVEAEEGQMKLNVDYTKDKDKDWSQATAVWEPEDGQGINLSGATSVTLNFVYL